MGVKDYECYLLVLLFIMATKKVRRHSGRTYPKCMVKEKKVVIINECLDPQPIWDDWIEYRDGARGYPDRTKIRPEHAMFTDFYDVKRWNKKIKRELKIRMARRENADR